MKIELTLEDGQVKLVDNAEALRGHALRRVFFAEEPSDDAWATAVECLRPHRGELFIHSRAEAEPQFRPTPGDEAAMDRLIADSLAAAVRTDEGFSRAMRDVYRHIDARLQFENLGLGLFRTAPFSLPGERTSGLLTASSYLAAPDRESFDALIRDLYAQLSIVVAQRLLSAVELSAVDSRRLPKTPTEQLADPREAQGVIIVHPDVVDQWRIDDAVTDPELLRQGYVGTHDNLLVRTAADMSAEIFLWPQHKQVAYAVGRESVGYVWLGDWTVTTPSTALSDAAHHPDSTQVHLSGVMQWSIRRPATRILKPRR